MRTTEPLPSFPRDQPAERDDRAYGLHRCEGCVVEADGHELGVVADVRFVTSADVPDFIAVRVGHLRHRLLLVPVAQVESVDLDAGRVRLSLETPVPSAGLRGS